MTDNNSFLGEISAYNLIYTTKSFDQESHDESIKLNYGTKNSYISEITNNFDDLYFQREEDNKINQINNDDKNNITDDNKDKKNNISMIKIYRKITR